MNLIIDVGNTRAKLAVYQNYKVLVNQIVSHEVTLQEVDNLLKNYSEIKWCIVSSVANFPNIEKKMLHGQLKLVTLNHNTKLPFQNKYASPKTLGVDRMALVSAATLHYPNKNVLIIDAGTCITYDYINSKNEYLGGAISPGLTIRYDALHKLTAKLPNLKPANDVKLIGDTTKTSIHSGVVNGIIHEIHGQIQDYKVFVKDLTIILTGGDTKFLANKLKSSIFANSNFLMDGLNHILEINKD